MNAAARAKAHNSLGHGRTRISPFVQKLDDRPVKRLTLELVTLADVYPHQHALTLESMHETTSSLAAHLELVGPSGPPSTSARAHG